MQPIFYLVPVSSSSFLGVLDEFLCFSFLIWFLAIETGRDLMLFSTKSLLLHGTNDSDLHPHMITEHRIIWFQFCSTAIHTEGRSLKSGIFKHYHSPKKKKKQNTPGDTLNLLASLGLPVVSSTLALYFHYPKNWHACSSLEHVRFI